MLKLCTENKQAKGTWRVGADQQKGLESLCLAGCTKVTDKGLAALLKGSPASRSLTSLDVSRCPGLSQTALDLPPKVGCIYAV